MDRSERYEQAVLTYAAWVTRWRWPVVLSVLVVSAVAATGIGLLKVSSDYKIYYEPDDPDLLAFERLEDVFTNTEGLIIALAPENGDIFTPENLRLLDEVTEEAWQIPHVIRVDSVTNFQHTYAEGDDIVVEELGGDGDTLSQAEVQSIREIALGDRRLVNALISPTGHVAGVQMSVQLPEGDEVALSEAVGAARELSVRIEDENPHVRTYLTGNIVMNVAFQEVSDRDMGTLIPLMYVGILIVMFLLLRTVSGTIAAASVVALATVTAMGVMGWSGVRITPVTAAAPLMLMTISIADSIHLLITALKRMAEGDEKRAAIAESLRVNMGPVFMTSLTTAVGFLSLNFSDSPPFRQLGTIVAVGVLSAFVYSITMLPGLFLILPIRRPKRRLVRESRMSVLADFVIAKRRPLFWGFGASALILFGCIGLNKLNDDFVKYFQPSVPFRADTDFVSENLAGSNRLDFYLGTGESGGISHPAYLAKLDEFAQWFRKQPHVMNVSSLSETMKHLNQAMHGGDPEYFKLPESRELAAQYLLLYEMSLPYGLDLNNQIDVDKSATRFVAMIEPVSTREMQELVARSENWLESNAPESMHSSPVGPAVMFAFISQRNIRNMLIGTTAALVLISGLLLIMFRSVRIGLVSLVPNLAPAGMAFGLWGLAVGEVGLGVSAVSAMSLGIVVDDTVHFLSKYVRGRREHNLAAPDAVRYAYSTVGAALVTTSLILMAGFLTLSLSSYFPNAMMGQLTAIVIGCALIADLLFLPTLLLRVDQDGNVTSQTNEETREDNVLVASF